MNCVIFVVLFFKTLVFKKITLAHFYKKVYRNSYSGSSLPNSSEKIRQIERADYYISVLKSKINKINKHLDFGCSTGIFLKKVSEQFDTKESIGIELGDGYRKATKRKWFNGLQKP